ncbi:MAG: hypothetical protein AAFZ65_13335 [Planctomycetota bacterium]
MTSTAPTKPKFHRRKVLISRRLQLRMTGTFVALACAASLFQVALLNFSLMRLEAVVDSGPLLETLPRLLTINLFTTLGVLVPGMTAVGILTTFRVAGPAYRMEQHLRAIARGEDPGECRIRENDDLHSLKDALNAALERLAQDREAPEDERTEQAA